MHIIVLCLIFRFFCIVGRRKSKYLYFKRKDRQPEFTQLDIELAFATPEEIMTLTENVISIKYLKKCLNVEIEELDFLKMSYNEAIDNWW